jgi:cytochrome c oxidase subunit 1
VDLVRDHDRGDGAMEARQSRAAGAPAMFGTVANAIMWLWTTAGVAVELLFQVIPAAFGWTDTVDVGCRYLFSWTLHAIVYFWLFPPTSPSTRWRRGAGGRLYSDTIRAAHLRPAPALQLPVGLHHLFMDPEHSTGSNSCRRH